jgi:hypothetical protein
MLMEKDDGSRAEKLEKRGWAIGAKAAARQSGSLSTGMKIAAPDG